MHPTVRFNNVSSEKNDRIDTIREKFSDLLYELDKLCLPGRETSLARTKIEEALFWAIKGVSREVDNE